jgi:prepilin-type N-terminal cleavage/methylation domain-containing protein
MVQKYTILKVLIQSSSKLNKSDKGFTLIELIVGLSIMLIISSLAMNTFIQSSVTFNQDKKSIDSSQNMSVVLEMVGSDIRQSGENISDSNFPTVEFKIANATDDPTLKIGSSKIIIRRAVSDPLTLCEPIAANTDPTMITSLVVADNTAATVTASANCDVGTASSQLFAARPSTQYQLTETVPSPALALILPKALRLARDYRCKLDNLNPTIAYDSTANATNDFCGASPLEVTKVAVSNSNGKLLIFNETNETVDAANTLTLKQYSISTNTTGLNASMTANNTKNKVVAYPIGSPIYLIEERVYTLTSEGYFQLSIDGQAPNTLIKKIDNFRVSAKGYTNTTDRSVNPTPPVAAADICADAPSSATATVNNPQYICKFNYNSAVTDPAMNWKMIAGVKVEIQSKYDGTGQNPTPTASDTAKLTSSAEFFPRNVLSK